MIAMPTKSGRDIPRPTHLTSPLSFPFPKIPILFLAPSLCYFPSHPIFASRRPRVMFYFPPPPPPPRLKRPLYFICFLCPLFDAPLTTINIRKGGQRTPPWSCYGLTAIPSREEALPLLPPQTLPPTPAQTLAVVAAVARIQRRRQQGGAVSLKVRAAPHVAVALRLVG